MFSPFVPLDVRSSANPVTVLRYSVKNTGSAPVEISFTGMLQNIAFPERGKVRHIQAEKRSHGITGLLLNMQAVEASNTVLKHPQFGGVALAVLDDKAHVDMGKTTAEEPAEGQVCSTFTLQPGETRTCICRTQRSQSGLHPGPTSSGRE